MIKNSIDKIKKLIFILFIIFLAICSPIFSEKIYLSISENKIFSVVYYKIRLFGFFSLSPGDSGSVPGIAILYKKGIPINMGYVHYINQCTTIWSNNKVYIFGCSDLEFSTE